MTFLKKEILQILPLGEVRQPHPPKSLPHHLKKMKAVHASLGASSFGASSFGASSFGASSFGASGALPAANNEMNII